LNGRIQVVIQGDVRFENTTEILLTDLYGRLVLHEFQNVAAATHLELDISKVVDGHGVYFLTLRHGVHSTVQKIVVQ
jgi:Secretion system C-terminal sorting domain